MPSIVNDIAEVIMVATIFSMSVVLSNLPTHVIVGQTSVAAGRYYCFTSGSFCLIIRSVTTRGLAPMVPDRWGHYDDVTRCLDPLLGQRDEWEVRLDHLPD
jgi:hypothetical protein